MDALDRLAEPGLDLLARVDTLLAAGAPEGHRLWPLLRRMQVLPGAAVREFLDLHPAPLTGAGHAVRRLVRGYDDTCALLGDRSPGPAPPRRRTTRRAQHCSGTWTRGRRAWSGGWSRRRVTRTRWPAGWRAAGSRWPARWPRCWVRPRRSPCTRRPGPASSAGPAGASAAAEIATRILGVLGVAYDGAETLLRQWGPSLAETVWRDRPAVAPHYGGTTRIGY